MVRATLASAAFDDRREFRLLRVVQLRGIAGRLPGAQPVRPLRVDAQHPFVGKTVHRTVF
jgi:hypothetical protein